MNRLIIVLTTIDLLVCLCLSNPVSARPLIAALGSLSHALGSTPIAYPGGVGAFFMNFAGVMGVLWSIALLSRSDRTLHRLDIVGRGAVAGLIVYHIVVFRLSFVFFAFAVTESLGAIAKLIRR